ncbi:MAG: chemotaxis-specific protein-glutamate methyltransferase CheB [Magnetococcales bacterium]|nr:chemotaxis-specific protein-glutamate methyltransferase CheB [Magnetococcales bacterium]
MTLKRTLRVMVVDDTITYRMIMKNVAESIPGIEVTATASNGKLALDKIRNLFKSDPETLPNVLLLDVEMPVMDGLATLKEINQNFSNITVVMVSALSRSNANIIVECLNAGALDFITKPLESHIDQAKAALRRDLEPILSILSKDFQTAESIKESHQSQSVSGSTVKAAPKTRPLQRPFTRVSVPPVSTNKSTLGSKKPAPNAARQADAAIGPALSPTLRAAQKKTSGMPISKPELVLIGSSTGGPAALTKVLGGLGGPLSVPILIVQHMPPVFTASLAAQLSRTSGIPVKEAEEGMVLTPGSITIAMGGRHMTIKNVKKSLIISLNDGAKVNECRPAVDVLFMSVAATFRGDVLAVILTGMGRDGANGVDALKRAGHTYCITQSKQSCVVYGMPRSVDEKNLSDLSLTLDEIGPTISKICL